MIDNCPIIDAGVWNKLNVGMPNSTISEKEFSRYINKANANTIVSPAQLKAIIKANTAYKTLLGSSEISVGCLIGASSVLLAGSEKTNFYIDETKDAGRKSVVGVDCILGVSKAKYQSSDGEITTYDNQDFAVIGLVSNME